MKIDVVIVSYNAERYIAQALESVFLQRLNKDVEMRIVIADDSSTDNTMSVINRMEVEHDVVFIYLTSDRNLGITGNYHRIFDFYADSDVDYIAILEGDDYWSSPYHLQQHIDFLDVHREVSMSVNSYTSFSVNEDGRIDYYLYPDTSRIWFYTREQILERNYVGNFSSCVFRRTCVSKIPNKIYGLDVPNFDDWLMGIEMSKYGLIAHLPDSTTMYRLTPHSAYSSKVYSEKMSEIYHRYHVYHEYIGGAALSYCIDAEKKQWKKDHWSPFRLWLFELLGKAKHRFVSICSFFLSKPMKKKLKEVLNKRT